MVLPEPIRITRLVAAVFDSLKIPYFVGGSLASSLHGIPRATQDADMVAVMKPQHVAPFVRALEATFYVDPEMIQDAVQRRSSFNVIHLETMFKIDVFLLQDDATSREAMARREKHDLVEESPQELFVASAEDIILHKLLWFQLGGGASERQWGDVMGVLQVRGENLDFAYLRKGAGSFGVGNLLNQAMSEAGAKIIPD